MEEEIVVKAEPIDPLIMDMGEDTHVEAARPNLDVMVRIHLGSRSFSFIYWLFHRNRLPLI
jgi:hypothetical protein